MPSGGPTRRCSKPHQRRASRAPKLTYFQPLLLHIPSSFTRTAGPKSVSCRVSCLKARISETKAIRDQSQTMELGPRKPTYLTHKWAPGLHQSDTPHGNSPGGKNTKVIRAQSAAYGSTSSAALRESLILFWSSMPMTLTFIASPTRAMSSTRST